MKERIILHRSTVWPLDQSDIWSLTRNFWYFIIRDSKWGLPPSRNTSWSSNVDTRTRISRSNPRSPFENSQWSLQLSMFYSAPLLIKTGASIKKTQVDLQITLKLTLNHESNRTHTKNCLPFPDPGSKMGTPIWKTNVDLQMTLSDLQVKIQGHHYRSSNFLSGPLPRKYVNSEMSGMSDTFWWPNCLTTNKIWK